MATTAKAAALAPTFQEIRDALLPVVDPEIHIGIVDLGLIYGVDVKREAKGSDVKVQMTLTSPACPYGPMLLAQVHGAVAKLRGVRDVDIDLVFNPLWDPRTMASEEAKDKLGIF